ncbi:MAG: NUDIX domain-containing protein [Armatimonadota bacterium]
METRIRVAALIVDEGRVLLVSTKKGREGFLVPPGGGLEPPETVAEAVVREALEEADLEVNCGGLVGYREVLHPGRFELELYFAAKLLQNPASVGSVSEENRKVCWVELSALPETPHFPEGLAALCQRQEEGGKPLYLGQTQIET